MFFYLPGKNSLSNGYDVQNTRIADINFNDFNFDSNTNSVLFRSTDFSVAEVDNMLVKVDAARNCWHGNYSF